MEFTDYIEQYPNVLPEWIKNIPIGIIEDIEALGFELLNVLHSEVIFDKQVDAYSKGRLTLTKEGIELKYPFIKDINKAQEYIIFLQNLQRINFIVNEYLLTVN
jgi:hypothetical protein